MHAKPLTRLSALRYWWLMHTEHLRRLRWLWWGIALAAVCVVVDWLETIVLLWGR